ncbi:MAG: hypothetical protein ACOX4O_05150 [Eubacteriales bacterium]
MKKMKKLTGLAALLLALLLFVSCGETAPAESDAAADQAETAAEEVTETELSAANLLPAADFEGRTFNISGRNYAKLGDLPSYEFTVESENGDLINDTIYARNLAVSERYNVNITSGQGDAGQLIPKSVMAGDGAYQLAWDHVNTMASLTLKGVLEDYSALPHIDISQPWWNRLATESLTVNGRCYLQMNYIPFTGVMLSHCLYYNMKLASDFSVGGIEEEVLAGSWTFDRLSERTAGVGADLDGNGVMDEKDLYGMIASHGTSGGAFAIAMGVIPMQVTAEGTPELLMSGDKNQKILEMINTMMHGDSAYLLTDYSRENELAKMFASSQGLFYSGFLTDSYQFFRDMTDDYGILPFPKYDEAQERYITTVTGGTGLLGVPKAQADPEFTGLVTEALAIESLRYVYPTVYETVVEEKLLRDERSKQMFDILMDGMAIDFGRTFKHGDYSDLICNLVASGANDLTSAEEKLRSKAEKHYQEVLDVFFSEDIG